MRRAAVGTAVVLILTLLPLVGVSAGVFAANPPPAAPPAANRGGFGAAAPAVLGPLGGNWSTYLQNPGRTSANLAERTLSPSNASQLAIRWTVATNGSDFGSPTVVNGTVYAGSWNGYEYALNASTGAVDWKTFLGTDPGCAWGSPMGVAGNAAVWNSTVYVGGGNDYWYALSAANGTVEWKIKVTDTSNGGYNWASPLLADGAEYIGIASCIDSPLVQGKLLMVNLTGNHSILHTFLTVPNGSVGDTIWTTPAFDAAANVVWLATGNPNGVSERYAESIVALNASTLAVLGYWQAPVPVSSDDDFGAGPTLFHDSAGRLLVGASNKNGVFYALNRSNVTSNGSWKPVWEDDAASGFSPAAFDGSMLYSGCAGTTINHTSYGGSVEALDPSNGTVQWTQGTDGTVDGGLAYANGLVFEGSGSTEEVLNAANGAMLATLNVPSGQYVDGAPSVADGQTFFESGDDSTHGAFLAAGIPFNATLTTSATNGSAPWPVQFHGLPAGGVPPYNFSWTFGDGSAGSFAPSPNHTFGPGRFNASVNVSDSANHSFQANVTVSVTPAVTASIAPGARSGPAPLNVSFSGTAGSGSGAPYTYSWSFSDGTPNATGATVRHEFLQPGVFPVTLTVGDSLHRTANASTVVTVTGAFAASLATNVSSGLAPLTVGFAASGTNGTAPYSFDWAFGDGSPNGSGTNVSHVYLVKGAYDATLVATDGRGVQRVLTTTITVGAAPVPLTTTLSVSNRTTNCPSPSWLTEAAAQPSGGSPPYTDSWTFGDGSAAVGGPVVNHSFARGGTFSVNLTTTDASGTTAETSERVTVTIPTCRTPVVPPSSSAAPAWTGQWAYVAIGAAVVFAVLAVVVVLWRRRRTA